MPFDKDSTITVPNILSVLTAIITLVWSYATLSAADASQEKAIDSIQQRQVQFAGDIEEIKVKTGKIEAGQDNQSKEIGLIRDDIKEVRAYMQQILRELRD